MKITTWNVNGLRAALRKGLLAWVAGHAPDVLCLQEIKARPEQLTDEQRGFGGYEAAWNPAERAGYSGVATLLRTPSAEVRLGLGESRFDIEGRVVCTRHPGFLLYNVYFPSGQRSRERVDFKLEFYAHLLGLLDGLQRSGESVVVTGDFNTAHRPIDLRNARQNIRTSGFLPEEREWIDRYLAHGFVDAYRQLYPERVEYTWWANHSGARERNVGWRLDYFLVSENLMPRVRDVLIHGDVPGSDHCPVTLELE